MFMFKFICFASGRILASRWNICFFIAWIIFYRARLSEFGEANKNWMEVLSKIYLQWLYFSYGNTTFKVAHFKVNTENCC